MVDSQRASTMRSRLGDAEQYIKDDNYLPMFRNRQINFPEEFKHSVEIAKRKDNPGNYLATVWSNSNIKKSLDWLRKMINLAQSRLAENRRAIQLAKQQQFEHRHFNQSGINRLNELKKKFNLKA